ncbi:hypothetical protein BGLA2_210070 [Burkholderia gladioli]|nr:hypothetical protein BGLA2_210070 [Burkholderia gladioli]
MSIEYADACPLVAEPASGWDSAERFAVGRFGRFCRAPPIRDRVSVGSVREPGACLGDWTESWPAAGVAWLIGGVESFIAVSQRGVDWAGGASPCLHHAGGHERPSQCSRHPVFGFSV